MGSECPWTQLRDDGCAQMRLEGADGWGSLSALLLVCTAGEKKVAKELLHSLHGGCGSACVLGVTPGALALASPTWHSGDAPWAPSAHPGEGSHHLPPLLLGLGPLGLRGVSGPLGNENQERCLGCCLMAEILRMPQGKPIPVNPWHFCPDPG